MNDSKKSTPSKKDVGKKERLGEKEEIGRHNPMHGKPFDEIMETIIKHTPSKKH